MSHLYIFHVAFHFTFFTILLVLHLFLYINLTAIIKMVMSEVLTMILLHPHMLRQPLFRRVCFVALITIKLQILHSQSKNRNLMIVFHNFSVFSAFSAGSVSSSDPVVVSLIFTASSEVSPISTATLAAAHFSFLLSLLAPAPLLGPL